VLKPSTFIYADGDVDWSKRDSMVRSEEEPGESTCQARNRMKERKWQVKAKIPPNRK
jgi:hypothetical protein